MNMEQSSSNRKVQYIVTLAVSLAAVTAGVSVFWSTPIMPKFHDNETSVHITDNQLSWMTAMSSPGFMAGSLMTRFIADRFGRRASILGSAVPYSIGTVILLCATNAWMLYVTRFLWGFATGIVITVSSIYVVEIADKDIRGTLSVGNRFMFNFGTFLVMAVGPFVSFDTLTYLLLALPVIFFSACWWIPETPYYYLKEGNVDAARKELSHLRGYKDEKILEEQLSLMRSNVKKEMRHSGSVKELFTGKQYRRALVISLGLKMTQVMSGTVAVQQYLGRIIQESKSGIQVSTALMIFGAIRFGVGVFSSVLVDKVGRRPMLICSYFCSSVCLIAVGIYFYYQEVITIDSETNPYGYIGFILIIISNIIATIGFDSIIFVIPAEIFPINVKSLALTFLNILGGCMNFAVVKSYQGVKDWSGLYGVFFVFGTVAFAGAVFCYFIVPETKGKSLSEIQVELQGKYYDEAVEGLKNGVNDNEMSELKELKVSEEK